MQTYFAKLVSIYQNHYRTIALISLLFSADMHAEEALDGEKLGHDFISCSIISSEHLTTLQLYQRGVPLETALESLPDISREAKKRVQFIYQLAKNIGILNAYADINTNFSRCANLVYKNSGKPFADQADYGYFFCAGENKRRFEIILYTDRYMDLDKVIEKAPDTHIDVAISYFKLIRAKGLLAAFDFTANNLKACLNNLRPSQN